MFFIRVVVKDRLGDIRVSPSLSFYDQSNSDFRS